MLVVPETVKEFDFEVYEKNQRYWIYHPKYPISNKSNPHVLGQIVLDDKTQLSNVHAAAQVNAALLLHGADSTAAAIIMNKVAQAYARQYVPSTVGYCPTDIPFPRAVEVAYRDVNAQPVGLGDGSESDLSATRLLNATVALEFMRRIVTEEQKYFLRTGHYDGSDDIIHAGLLEWKDFSPPGYCIEVFMGTKTDKHFTMSPDVKAPNYYILIGAPIHWGLDGDVYLYADPTGIVRYTRSQKELHSLSEAPPVTKDFPLDLVP